VQSYCFFLKVICKKSKNIFNPDNKRGDNKVKKLLLQSFFQKNVLFVAQNLSSSKKRYTFAVAFEGH